MAAEATEKAESSIKEKQQKSQAYAARKHFKIYFLNLFLRRAVDI